MQQITVGITYASFTPSESDGVQGHSSERESDVAFAFARCKQTINVNAGDVNTPPYSNTSPGHKVKENLIRTPEN